VEVGQLAPNLAVRQMVEDFVRDHGGGAAGRAGLSQPPLSLCVLVLPWPIGAVCTLYLNQEVVYQRGPHRYVM